PEAARLSHPTGEARARPDAPIADSVPYRALRAMISMRPAALRREGLSSVTDPPRNPQFRFDYDICCCPFTTEPLHLLVAVRVVAIEKFNRERFHRHRQVFRGVIRTLAARKGLDHGVVFR